MIYRRRANHTRIAQSLSALTKTWYRSCTSTDINLSQLCSTEMIFMRQYRDTVQLHSLRRQRGNRIHFVTFFPHHKCPLSLLLPNSRNMASKGTGRNVGYFPWGSQPKNWQQIGIILGDDITYAKSSLPLTWSCFYG